MMDELYTDVVQYLPGEKKMLETTNFRLIEWDYGHLSSVSRAA